MGKVFRTRGENYNNVRERNAFLALFRRFRSSGLSRKGPGKATERYYMEPRRHGKTPESHVNISGMPICLYFTFTVLQSTSFHQCKAILYRVNIAIGSFLRM